MLQTSRGAKATKLTSRESQILKLITDGFTNNEIAEHLSLSSRTIEAHRARVILKLAIHDIPGLVKYAVLNGLSSVDDHRII